MPSVRDLCVEQNTIAITSDALKSLRWRFARVKAKYNRAICKINTKNTVNNIFPAVKPSSGVWNVSQNVAKIISISAN